MSDHQGRSDRNKDEGEEQKRKVSGEIHVRGEIEANVPSSLVEKYKAARQENTSRDNWRFFVECVTLIVVAIYAGLTYWQARSTAGQLSQARLATKIAQDEYNLSQRPWVDIHNIEPGKLVITPGNWGGYLDTTAHFTNFGHSVATQVSYIPWILSVAENTPTKLCDLPEGAKEEFQVVGNGFVVFPENTVQISQPVPFALKKDPSNGVSLMLEACVAYHSPIDSDVHYTRAEYFINDGPKNIDWVHGGTYEVHLLHNINGAAAQ